jgi:hypothetical protein
MLFPPCTDGSFISQYSHSVALPVFMNMIRQGVGYGCEDVGAAGYLDFIVVVGNLNYLVLFFDVGTSMISTSILVFLHKNPLEMTSEHQVAQVRAHVCLHHQIISQEYFADKLFQLQKLMESVSFLFFTIEW